MGIVVSISSEKSTKKKTEAHSTKHEWANDFGLRKPKPRDGKLPHRSVWLPGPTALSAAGGTLRIAHPEQDRFVAAESGQTFRASGQDPKCDESGASGCTAILKGRQRLR